MRVADACEMPLPPACCMHAPARNGSQLAMDRPPCVLSVLGGVLLCWRASRRLPVATPAHCPAQGHYDSCCAMCWLPPGPGLRSQDGPTAGHLIATANHSRQGELATALPISRRPKQFPAVTAWPSEVYIERQGGVSVGCRDAERRAEGGLERRERGWGQKRASGRLG